MKEVLFTQRGITKTEVMTKEEFTRLKRDNRVLILSAKTVDKKDE